MGVLQELYRGRFEGALNSSSAAVSYILKSAQIRIQETELIKVKPLNDREILLKVVQTVKNYLPEATVYLFGSRAQGRERKNSDFDIAIEWKEKVPLCTIYRIREELEELPTLKSFDIVDLKRCSREFAESVRETGVILYERKRTDRET